MNAEWLTDEQGRRFRWIGKGIKEYEMMVSVAGGISIPESQLEEYNRMRAEAARQEREKQQKAVPLKACPFKNGVDMACRADCMLRTVHGCAIVYLVDRAPTAAQASGKSCPFNPYMCRGEGCELWRSGCVLTAI